MMIMIIIKFIVMIIMVTTIVIVVIMITVTIYFNNIWLRVIIVFSRRMSDIYICYGNEVRIAVRGDQEAVERRFLLLAKQGPRRKYPLTISPPIKCQRDNLEKKLNKIIIMKLPIRKFLVALLTRISCICMRIFTFQSRRSGQLQLYRCGRNSSRPLHLIHSALRSVVATYRYYY